PDGPAEIPSSAYAEALQPDWSHPLIRQLTVSDLLGERQHFFKGCHADVQSAHALLEDRQAGFILSPLEVEDGRLLEPCAFGKLLRRLCLELAHQAQDQASYEATAAAPRPSASQSHAFVSLLVLGLQLEHHHFTASSRLILVLFGGMSRGCLLS